MQYHGLHVLLSSWLWNKECTVTSFDHAGESVHGAMLTGAFTRAFLDSWDQHPVQSYTDVLRHTRQQLLGGFDQVTQLSASINADINVAMEV